MENSPFNKLSGELRNQIYELVLVHDRPITVTVSKPLSTLHSLIHEPLLVHDRPATVIATAREISSELRSTSFDCVCNRHPLALLHTCKQMANEATSLFYLSNTFSMQPTKTTQAHSVATKDELEQAKDELCLAQRFCGSIGSTAFASLRNLHVYSYSATDWSDYHDQPFVSKTVLRQLLGIQDIWALNNELRIKYTFSFLLTCFTCVVTADEVGEDTKDTLLASIDWVRAKCWFRDPELQQALIKDLRFLRRAIFGIY